MILSKKFKVFVLINYMVQLFKERFKYTLPTKRHESFKYFTIERSINFEMLLFVCNRNKYGLHIITKVPIVS